MTENLDLKEIEKKTWRSFFEDGIFEIYMGTLHVGVGIAWSFIDVAPFSIYNLFGIMLIVFGFLFFILGKRFITYPRVGKIKFGRKRKVRKLKTIIVLSVNLVILLIFYLIGLLFGLFLALMYIPGVQVWLAMNGINFMFMYLSLLDWIVCFGISLICILNFELAKFIARKRGIAF